MTEKSYYRMVTIDMTSDTGTDLVVRYTKTADGTQDGNITFAAAALRDPNAEPGEEVNKAVERTVEVTHRVSGESKPDRRGQPGLDPPWPGIDLYHQPQSSRGRAAGSDKFC